MKIIKPYGYTRVHSSTRVFHNQTKEQQHLSLKDTLETDPDALIAVWVSTIDKVFGKPYGIKAVKYPDKTKEQTDADYQAIKDKCDHSRQAKIDLAALRGKVIAECEKALFTAKGSTQPRLEGTEENHKIWQHKLKLSTVQEQDGDPRGCKRSGKLADALLHTVDNTPINALRIAQAIERHIHEAEIGSQKGKKDGRDNAERAHGLISNCAHSVRENTHNQKLKQGQLRTQSYSEHTICQVSRKSAPRLTCKSAPVYERFLNRNESLPVSIISQ